jgi:hypothetical protein
MKRLLLALLAAIAVVAVVIAVALATREAPVELNFVRWETNGAAQFLLVNRSGRTITPALVHVQWQFKDGTWTGSLDPFSHSRYEAHKVRGTISDGTNRLFHVYGRSNGPWRAAITYERSGGILDTVRTALAKTRLVKPPVPRTNRVESIMITNTPLFL